MASSHENGECSYTKSSNQEQNDLEKSLRMGYEEIDEIVNRSLQEIKAIGLTKIDGTEVTPANRVDAARRGVDAARHGVDAAMHDPPRSVVLDIYEESNRREADAGLLTRSQPVHEILQPTNTRVENPIVENVRVENPRVENVRVENPRVDNASATGSEAPTGGEPASIPSTRKIQFWVDSVTLLQTCTGAAAFGSTIMCAGFGLFGTKALGDFDTCDGGTTGASVKVVTFSVIALGLFWISLFLTFPLTTKIRGYADKDLASRKIRRRTKCSFILDIIVVMGAVLFMGLATFYFIQVRLGAWQCTSSGTRVSLMFIWFVICFIDFFLFGIISYISKA